MLTVRPTLAQHMYRRLCTQSCWSLESLGEGQHREVLRKRSDGDLCGVPAALTDEEKVSEALLSVQPSAATSETNPCDQGGDLISGSWWMSPFSRPCGLSTSLRQLYLRAPLSLAGAVESNGASLRWIFTTTSPSFSPSIPSSRARNNHRQTRQLRLRWWIYWSPSH